MKTNTLWEYFDFMSVEAKLFIKGKDRMKTKFGMLMSILSFISIIVISAFFVKYFFEKVDLNVLFIKEVQTETFYMDLNFKPFFFRLFDIDNNDVDQRLVSLTIRNFNFKDEETSWQTLELESCNWDKHLPDPKYKKMLEGLNFETYQCIRNDKYNLNITYNPFNNNQYYFNIYVSECNNSTFNNNSCYPQEKIKDYLSSANIYFQYYYPGYRIDHYNSEFPLQESPANSGVKIYNDMFYAYTDNFKKVKYTSDDGPVFQDINTYTLFGKDESSSVEIALKGSVSVPNTMTVFTLGGAVQVDSYKRTYQKFQSVLANIGGALKFIMTMANFLSKFISSQMLDVELTNNFICEESKEEIKSRTVEKTCSSQLTSKVLSSERNMISIKPKLNFSPIKKVKRQKLTFWEALLPKSCLQKKSSKHNLDLYSKIIKSYMSTDKILKLFKDFENLKYLCLNEKELELFESMRSLTIKDHLVKIENQKRLNNLKIRNLAKKISENENFNKKILSKLVEQI